LFRSRKLAIFLIAAFFSTAAGAANSPTDSPACAATPADQTQIVETVHTMYAAAATDDLAKFHTVAAPDFYAFDGGTRYDGDALMNTLKSLHASGKVYVWTVIQPHVESDCHLAWITYINRGSIKDASGTKNLTWLESAVLEKQAGAWRIRFFHSTRVP
jgi:ABC-type glycerol-3-phosphate transport system substrate-binding protein